jgi:hypothetical protein
MTELGHKRRGGPHGHPRGRLRRPTSTDPACTNTPPPSGFLASSAASTIA